MGFILRTYLLDFFSLDHLLEGQENKGTTWGEGNYLHYILGYCREGSEGTFGLLPDDSFPVLDLDLPL